MPLQSSDRIVPAAAWRRAGVVLGLLALLLCATGCVSEASRNGSSESTAASPAPESPAPEEQHGQLEPRYQPREPQPKSWYNSSYLFGMTRGVTNSTMAPAAKAPLLVLTIPLDIVLLPFAAIGGLFG